MQATSLGLPLRGSSDFYVGGLLVQPNLNQISTDNAQIRLEPKAMQVLLCLAKEPGKVCSKEQLIHSAWPDTFVTDQVLTHAIWQLRQAFSELDHQGEFIHTIPKGGYRLVAPVRSAARKFPLEFVQKPQASSPRTFKPGAIALFSASILLLLAVAVALMIHSKTSASPHKVMLVVLPFENLTGDPSQDFFSDGITEEITAQLSRLNPERLGVIGRSSAMVYKGAPHPVDEIGRTLKAEYILEGSVRQDGHRVRITAQLIAAKDQTHIWAENYEQDRADILKLQSDIAAAIARKINANITSPKLKSSGSGNPKLRELYLQGRHHLENRHIDGAITEFEQIVAQEPTHADAYAGLALSYSIAPVYGSLTPKDAAPKAKWAADQALQLNESSAEAHAAKAFTLLIYDWQWTQAEDEFKRALELNPTDQTANLWYGDLLAFMGRADEAAAQMLRARDLAPTSPATLANVAAAFYLARHYDKVIEYSNEAIRMNNADAPAYVWLGLAYVQMHKFQEGIALLEKSADLANDAGRPQLTHPARLGYAYGVAGQTAKAKAILEQLETASKAGYVPATNFAIVYIGLGDREAALSWLNKGYEEHSWELVMLKADPRFDPLRTDPRFQDILRRINLADNFHHP